MVKAKTKKYSAETVEESDETASKAETAGLPTAVQVYPDEKMVKLKKSISELGDA